MDKKFHYILNKNITLLFILFFYGLNAQNGKFKTIHFGHGFTSIAIDYNNNIWAGSDKNGIFFLDRENPSNLDFKLLSLGTSPSLSAVKINSLASDILGNIWVAHEGINSMNVQGGVERIDVKTHNVHHFTPDTNAIGLPYVENDGINTRNSQQIIVTRNNMVWVAQKYHDITSVGGGSNSYVMTPGTFAYKTAYNDNRFTSISTWRDYINKTITPGFPYPAYTYNPNISKTPQGRSCNAISANSNYAWISVAGYEEHLTGTFFPSRLIEYSVKNNNIISSTTLSEAGFKKNGVFNGVYIKADNDDLIWSTTTMVDNGFSVRIGKDWHNINSDKLIPPDTKFNQGAIWGDDKGRVYLGTNRGLIVYDGIGSPASIGSYTLYSKNEYKSCTRNIVDIFMFSENIISGSNEFIRMIDDKESHSWVATDKGIMQFSIGEGRAIVYHIEDLEHTKDEFFNNKRNYTQFAELDDKKDLTSENIPSFAVDGTTSSVLRIKYGSVIGNLIYNQSGKILIEILDKSDNIIEKYNYEEILNKVEKYSPLYGSFHLKPIEYYEGKPKPEDLDYLDIIIKHPNHIDQNYIEAKKNHTEYKIIIKAGFEETNNDDEYFKIFEYPINFCLPPVLLVHGVWTDIFSLKKFKNFLKDNGYSEFELMKSWRKDGTAAENPYEQDSYVVPTYINKLKNQAVTKGKISAGKVNLITHSRGGLYTRGYVQGLDPKFPYNNDINSLITFNTPHSGSQTANAVMDQRIILKNLYIPKLKENITLWDKVNLNFIDEWKNIGPIAIGDIFSLAAVPEKDKEGNWGAKNLMVVNDELSKSNTSEIKFIKNLSKPSSLDNFRKADIPVHAVATTFNVCEMNPIFCSGVSNYTEPLRTSTKIVWLKVLLYAVKVIDKGPESINDIIKYIYDGEDNDVIVPKRSMEGGLGNSFISQFTGHNIMHIDPGNFVENWLNSSGVMANNHVHEKTLNLLKSNLNLSDTSGSPFTKKGFNPPSLRYNFLPMFKGRSISKVDTKNINDKKIVIDPNSFTSDITSGDKISFDVYQENIDHILIFLDYPYLGYTDYFEKDKGLSFKNTFSLTLPDEFSGKFSVTVYGISSDEIVSMHQLEPTVKPKQNLKLESIRFRDLESVNILEQTTYNYELLGKFDDGIERIINDWEGISFTIEDNSILEQIDNRIVKGIKIGTTTLTANINNLETTLDIIVETNPTLTENFITSFYTEYDKTNYIKVIWETYQEYKSNFFTLEKSENNDLNFVVINKQSAQGTKYEPTEYSFVDDTKSKKVFYRLNLYNSDNEIVYTQIIEINREESEEPEEEKPGVEEPEEKIIFMDRLSIAPNPLHSDNAILLLPAYTADDNAEINIFTINGQLIHSKKYIIKEKDNKLEFSVPTGIVNGVYIVQLKTKNHKKSVKLILKR